MPYIEGKGYFTPKTEDSIVESLTRLYSEGNDNDRGIIHLSHNPPKENATRPGTNPLGLALKRISTAEYPLRFLALAEHEDAGTQAKAFSEGIGGEVITLNKILEQSPGFSEAKLRDPILSTLSLDELMRIHGDRVHLLSYLNSHDIALRASLKKMGIDDPDAYVANLLDARDIHVASFIDAAVGSWIIRHRRIHDLVDRDDWPPAMINYSLSGDRIQADIGNNHGIVPKLDRVLRMEPRLRDYQLRLFGNMITLNNVTALHTDRDSRNLQEIADYLGIPHNHRATLFVRDLIPPSFTEFEVQGRKERKVAPFLDKAVNQGKIIAGVVERLDLIKMDLNLLDNLAGMITKLNSSPDGQDMLRDLRIAMVARPANFPEGWKMRGIYGKYNEAVEDKIKFVNDLFRNITGQNEDFILAHRDEKGKLAGYPHDKLKDEVYPYFNIAFQLGQEGLCQTVQEALLTTTLGLGAPRPAIVVTSDYVGFSEKAQKNQLPGVIVVKNPINEDQVTAAFLRAYRLASLIRSDPNSKFVKDIVQGVIKYYDNCGDSFYPGILETLRVAREEKK